MATGNAPRAVKTPSPAVTVKMRSLIDWFLSLFRSPPKATTPHSSDSQSPDHSTEHDHDPKILRERKDPDTGPGAEAPWLAIARAEDGTREIAGRGANPKITDYFKDAGHPEVVDDETAWCAAFVGACLVRAGYAGTNSLLARSFLRWGKPCARTPGAVCVFWRGKSDNGQDGHVGFYVGEDHDSIFILGGNQWNPSTGRSEIVNVGKQPKAKLLGVRWPSTPTQSRTMAGGATAGLGVAVQQASSTLPVDFPSDQIKEIGSKFEGLAGVKWWLGVIGTGLIVAGICWSMWARWDDMRKKGT